MTLGCGASGCFGWAADLVHPAGCRIRWNSGAKTETRQNLKTYYENMQYTYLFERSLLQKSWITKLFLLQTKPSNTLWISSPRIAMQRDSLAVLLGRVSLIAMRVGQTPAAYWTSRNRVEKTTNHFGLLISRKGTLGLAHSYVLMSSLVDCLWEIHLPPSKILKFIWGLSSEQRKSNFKWLLKGLKMILRYFENIMLSCLKWS